MERPAFAWEACSMVLVQRRSQQVLSHVTFKQCLCLKLQLCPRLHMNPSATLEVVYGGGSESGISVPEASQPEKDTHSGWMTPRQCSVHHALLAHHLCCMDLSPWLHPETRKVKFPLCTRMDVKELMPILSSCLSAQFSRWALLHSFGLLSKGATSKLVTGHCFVWRGCRT